MTKILIVKSIREGYRRLGRAFSSTNATTLKVDDLTPEDVETLKTDAGLVVVESTEGADAGAVHENAQVNAELESALKEMVATAEGTANRVKELEHELDQLKKAAAKAAAEGSAQNEALKADLVKAEKAAADAAKAAKK